MPSADWTSISNGSGVFAIIADGTAPSPPDVMNISSGGQHFQNITGGPFMNSRISGWMNKAIGVSGRFHLVLRSLNTTFSAAPATYFLASLEGISATHVRITLSAIVGGVVTDFLASVDVPSQNGEPRGTWQQYRFSSFNSGTDILLRIEQWNGAAFVPIADAAAPIASFPTLNAAGSGRFGALTNSPGFVIDDVAYYSLA